ncbi:type III-A CRISPR-associated protein Csm2 [Campylobacter gastrosuis]|uniref:CRISPR system Cms protein Csm2 n=1 Tax=Campylobacter gastrosuis TaxID=2974576 RepID=A0ABT7HRW1_9BACT|nr:type III-A CRISPR-associated protein Csm2 [Campylobacter gastrosuis]MDL0089652.1 type III-A CRISPR-associated protein Csm2 [Campylobacter gastrosuis]
MSDLHKKPSNHQNRSNQNQNNQQPQIPLPQIVLDYKKDKELLNQTAEKTANAISKMTSNQIRNFYDYVLNLNERANSEDFDEILPFVKMLNSKVAYSKGKGNADQNFVQMIKKCIEQVNTKDDLNVFKLFFEAVLGFYKNKEKEKER